MGPNGIGKTNLLLAIYYSAYAKVYKSGLADVLNISNGKDEMSIIAHFVSGDTVRKAAVELTTSGKKLYLDDTPIKKLTEYVRHHHLVMVTPDDIQIINGSSDNRRGFLDMLLSKLNSEYLDQLLKYKKYHRSRNAYLKMRKGSSLDTAYLDSIDHQYIQHMQAIYESRAAIFEDLEGRINTLYHQIARKDDKIALRYVSTLKDQDAQTLLQANRSIDQTIGRTTEGVHRDNILITINGKSAKDFASQGQKKSILFAMRLAEMQLIESQQGRHPLVMIDDLFEKLDEQRIQNLLNIMTNNQVIMTDTSYERMRKLLGDEAHIIKLS